MNREQFEAMFTRPKIVARVKNPTRWSRVKSLLKALIAKPPQTGLFEDLRDEFFRRHTLGAHVREIAARAMSRPVVHKVAPEAVDALVSQAEEYPRVITIHIKAEES